MNAHVELKPYRLVGTRPVRPDGVDKVTGKAIYGPDFTVPGMLFGAIARSPHAHARIRSIDTSRAAALPGVKAVVTGQDFPLIEAGMVALGESSADITALQGACMARDKALFEGHAIAAVAATTQQIADDAARLIVVDYEVLPHVNDLEAAMAPGAPILHEKLVTRGVEGAEGKPTNVVQRFELASGDVAAALAGAAHVASGRFSAPPVHQGYIEPHAAVASWNSDGQAQIWSSSQGAFMVRGITAAILDMPIGNIRATPLEIGGGFGGKTTIYLEPVAMLLSRKAGHPVRLVMNRQDIFRASGPAPGIVADIRVGCDAEGVLVGLEMDFRMDAGAFPGSNVGPAAMTVSGYYNCPNMKLVGWEVVTNMASVAAYRAPGAPQGQFGVECCLDELAQKLGMDPIDLRLRNIKKPGDPGMMGMPCGEIGFAECLEAAKAHPHWTAPLGERQGRGVAAGYWFNYGGPSTAAVALSEDGSLIVTIGNPDIGGSRASMALMAAETMGLPYEQVRVTVGDTSSIGFSMLTGGSRTTFATGKAVIEACQRVIDRMKAHAAAVWGVEPAGVEWRDGEARCLSGENAGKTLTARAIGQGANNAAGPIVAEVSVNPHDHLPGFGVHICDTEIDPETGNVLVRRYTVVQDVGRAIHPDYVEGQMQGGAVQGIGWALNEGYVFDRHGRVDNPGFLDYRMPVASDMPMIDTLMIEKPNPGHPYGVKGVGEVPIVPPLAAVANAVSAASGKRQRNLPLTPDRVLATIRG